MGNPSLTTKPPGSKSPIKRKLRRALKLRAVGLPWFPRLKTRWDSDHELAWTWLWENVENLLSAMLGKPAMQAGRDSLGEMQTARM